MKDIPNPGSYEAIRLGCKCPVMDNNNGRWPPYPPDGWWMVFGCPVHGPNSRKSDKEQPELRVGIDVEDDDDYEGCSDPDCHCTEKTPLQGEA